MSLMLLFARTTDLPGFIQRLWDSVSADPTALAVRGSLTVFVLLLALTLGRWLAKVAGNVPGRVERRRPRPEKNGNQAAADQGGLGAWVTGVTLTCIWIVALVAIAFIWFSDEALKNLAPTNLGQWLGDLALRLIGSLLVIVGTLVVARILQRGLVSSLGRRVNQNLALLCGRLVYTGGLAVGLVLVLAIWGTGVVLPVALAGALTVALSLALQDVLKNLVAGVYLLLEHPFVIGDHIALQPYVGRVEDIQIRYTALRTEDGQKVIIPNSMLFSSAVVNLSAFGNRRAGFSVTLPDNAPNALDVAEEQIRAALDDTPGILKQPEPRVEVSKVAGGKLELEVAYWIPTAELGQSGAIFSEALEHVRARVPEAEVTSLETSAV